MTNADFAHDQEELINWLHERSMKAWKIEDLQSSLIGRLEGLGFQIHRMHIGMPILHPLYTVGAYYWKQGEGNTSAGFIRGAEQQDAWQKSPIRAINIAGIKEQQFRPDAPENDKFPLLAEMAQEGVTDYYVQSTGFTGEDSQMEGQDAVALTWATTRPGGFSPEQIRFLSKLRLPLSALVKSLAQRNLVEDILDTYLGTYSGSRVLSGKIQRGDVDPIHAVILFCDLRKSSTLANQYAPADFLHLLNRYFEMTAGIFVAHGGEILRFIGDASLAIFPIDKFDNEQASCLAAAKACEEARAAGRALNKDRAGQNELPLNFGIGLHKGEVLYGNMGIPSRLEFTVIGEAANEAARIESKCVDLGEDILASKTFVDCLGEPWQSHGSYSLKNINDPIEIFSPSSPTV